MNFYFKSPMDVAGYVAAMVQYSKPDCVLTMTMRPVNSGGFCVHTAIGTSSEDFDLQKVSDFLRGQLSI